MGVCNIHKPLVGLHKDQPTELSCVCFVHSTVCFVCHTVYFKYNRAQMLQGIVGRKTGMISMEVTRQQKSQTKQKLERQ